MYTVGRGGYTRGAPPRGAYGGPGAGRGFSNGEDDGRVQTCYKCGGPNHFARDCHAKSVKCYACGKFEGHIVRNLSSIFDLIGLFSLENVLMRRNPKMILRLGRRFKRRPPKHDHFITHINCLRILYPAPHLISVL